MADLIQSHKGICSLNVENYEISLLVFDKFFFTRLTQPKTYHCNLTSFCIAHLTKLKKKFWNATYCNCNLTNFYPLLECRTIMRLPFIVHAYAILCICLPGLLPTVMPLTAIAIWRVFITFLSPWMNAELECAITRHCAPHSHASWYVGLLCTAAAVCT